MEKNNQDELMFETFANFVEFLDIFALNILPEDIYKNFSQYLKSSITACASSWEDVKKWILNTDLENPENILQICSILGVQEFEPILAYTMSAHPMFWNELTIRFNDIKDKLKENLR